MRWYRLALLLAVAGCGGEAACPLIGCSSQLTVRLPAGVSAGKACVADVCTTTVVQGQRGPALLVPLSRGAEGDTALVTVTLAGAAPYVGEVALQRTRPNGQNCPPVCVNGTAVVDAAGGRVITAAD